MQARTHISAYSVLTSSLLRLTWYVWQHSARGLGMILQARLSLKLVWGPFARDQIPNLCEMSHCNNAPSILRHQRHCKSYILESNRYGDSLIFSTGIYIPPRGSGTREWGSRRQNVIERPGNCFNGIKQSVNPRQALTLKRNKATLQ